MVQECRLAVAGVAGDDDQFVAQCGDVRLQSFVEQGLAVGKAVQPAVARTRASAAVAMVALAVERIDVVDDVGCGLLLLPLFFFQHALVSNGVQRVAHLSCCAEAFVAVCYDGFHHKVGHRVAQFVVVGAYVGGHDADTGFHLSSGPGIGMNQQLVEGHAQGKGVGRVVPVYLFCRDDEVWSHVGLGASERLVLWNGCGDVEVDKFENLASMPHDVAGFDVAVINVGLFALHVAQCVKYLVGHLVYFVVGKPHAAVCVLLQVLALEQFHQGVEEAAWHGAVVPNEADNVGVVKSLQCFEFVDGVVHRCAAIEDLDGIILFLQVVPDFENFPEAAFA